MHPQQDKCILIGDGFVLRMTEFVLICPFGARMNCRNVSQGAQHPPIVTNASFTGYLRAVRTRSHMDVLRHKMRRLCIALVISVLAGTCLAQTRPIDPQRSVLAV